jgi:hypothetical protein
MKVGLISTIVEAAKESNRWIQYEQEKKQWDLEHPEADCAERDRAMREIANRLGI